MVGIPTELPPRLTTDKGFLAWKIDSTSPTTLVKSGAGTPGPGLTAFKYPTSGLAKLARLFLPDFGWSGQGWPLQGWPLQGWSCHGWSCQGWSLQGWPASSGRGRGTFATQSKAGHCLPLRLKKLARPDVVLVLSGLLSWWWWVLRPLSNNSLPAGENTGAHFLVMMANFFPHGQAIFQRAAVLSPKLAVVAPSERCCGDQSS